MRCIFYWPIFKFIMVTFYYLIRIFLKTYFRTNKWIKCMVSDIFFILNVIHNITMFINIKRHINMFIILFFIYFFLFHNNPLKMKKHIQVQRPIWMCSYSTFQDLILHYRLYLVLFNAAPQYIKYYIIILSKVLNVIVQFFAIIIQSKRGGSIMNFNFNIIIVNIVLTINTQTYDTVYRSNIYYTQ